MSLRRAGAAAPDCVGSASDASAEPEGVGERVHLHFQQRLRPVTHAVVETFVDLRPTEGGVLVHTEESWTGAPVVADTATLQAALDTSLQNWMNNLKRESESHS